MNCKHCGKEIVKNESLGWVTACFGDVQCFTEMSRNPRQGGHEPASPVGPQAEPSVPIELPGPTGEGSSGHSWVEPLAALQPLAVAQSGAGGEAHLELLEKAASLLEMMYDKWENGDPSFSEAGDSLGNAFQLGSHEDKIIEVLNKLSPWPSSPSGQAAATTPECDCGAGPHLKTCNLGLYKGVASPTGGAEPPKYTNRHGEPCSEACGEGRHAECTETGQTCNCTYRGLHKTMHRYATIPPAASEPSAEQFYKSDITLPSIDKTYQRQMFSFAEAYAAHATKQSERAEAAEGQLAELTIANTESVRQSTEAHGAFEEVSAQLSTAREIANDALVNPWKYDPWRVIGKIVAALAPAKEPQ